MDRLVFATMNPREFFARVDDDMTLEEAAEIHRLADDAGITPEPIDLGLLELELTGGF